MRVRVRRAPMVAAVLLPSERSQVEAAVRGCASVVYGESVGDALRMVREQPVDALLVSVHRCRHDQLAALGHGLRAFPSLPAVALVSQHDPGATELLLRLGAQGVRQVIDVTTPAGWVRLRQIVGRPASHGVARMQGAILAELEGAPPDARLFMEGLLRLAPDTPTVRHLARQLGVRTGSLLTRFARARLPSPKTYLAAVRLVHAAHMFEDMGRSIADVAYRLEYSSPQAFGRHLRSLLGITPTEFRRRLPFDDVLNRFVAHLIQPYRSQWMEFHPLPCDPQRIGSITLDREDPML